LSADLAIGLLLAIAGTWLWIGHGRARDLGSGSDVLGYDAAQYAVAARELANHGRLATPFALPIELVRHARPPWPLSLVQPGLLAGEAALFRLSGTSSPARLAWLVLVIPFLGYLGAGIAVALGVSTFLARFATHATPRDRTLAALVVGLALLLDPEAQHYATGGFTELPFTAGLAAAVAWLAAGAPPPFAFGVLLGLTGTFRGNMLWLAPVLAAALALTRPAGRGGAFVRAMLGYAVVLAPWWIYKTVAFGTPAWDLSALSVWDGVGGRTWFSLNHLPALPAVPHGGAAVHAIGAKLLRNLRPLLLQLATGPRTLWIAGLVLALVPWGWVREAATPADEDDAGAERRARIVAGALLAVLGITVIVTAITVPILRYLLPVRLIAEAAGLVGVWIYLWRMPEAWAPARARRLLGVAIAVLALGWGVRQSARGMTEAAAVSADRGIPPAAVLQEIARDLDRELPPSEPVMSNLGPSLAWYSRRPVIHLALTPSDVDACRERLEVHHVVLAFRDASRAWLGWDEVVAHPADAPHHPEWNVLRVRRWTVTEGFSLVWLELGPPRTPLAERAR